MKNPITVTLVAVGLAALVNGYYFATGTDLTVVVSRTLFADMMLVLTMVPVYEAIRVQSSTDVMTLPDRIQSGMKPVAMFTLVIAIITFILFKIFGGPLVAAKMTLLTKQAIVALESGKITKERMDEVLEMTRRFYSVSFFLPIVLLVNLFIGFISSLLAALLVRK